MNTQEMIDLCKRHTIYTWGAGKDVSPLPVSRAEGVYFYTADGQAWVKLGSAPRAGFRPDRWAAPAGWDKKCARAARLCPDSFL